MSVILPCESPSTPPPPPSSPSFQMNSCCLQAAGSLVTPAEEPGRAEAPDTFARSRRSSAARSLSLGPRPPARAHTHTDARTHPSSSLTLSPLCPRRKRTGFSESDPIPALSVSLITLTRQKRWASHRGRQDAEEISSGWGRGGGTGGKEPSRAFGNSRCFRKFTSLSEKHESPAGLLKPSRAGGVSPQLVVPAALCRESVDQTALAGWGPFVMSQRALTHLPR